MISTAGFAAVTPRAPQGMYARFDLGDTVNQAYSQAWSGVSNPPVYPEPVTDAMLVGYFTALLDNPAISGLSPEIPWSLLNPNDPALVPAAQAYDWNPLDDVFTAVNKWNKSHSSSSPKTIQLIVNSGYTSPLWLFNEIDNEACVAGQNCTGAGSCDGLFMTPQPTVSSQCGYTTLFWQVEAGTPDQQPLPLPWNSVYQNEWETFLTALNQQIQAEKPTKAFVSIEMSGPTASTTEMILPSPQNQRLSPYPPSNPDRTSTNVLNGQAYLTLLLPGVVPPGETASSVTVSTAWNLLFQNYYGDNTTYTNTDQPFIDAWNQVIGVYGKIFDHVTLILTTTTDALPSFAVPSSSPTLIPAPGFESDCDDAVSGPNKNLARAMQCAAVTQVLANFTSSSVGGHNAKATQENGMTAARDGTDLGTNGIRWLASYTAVPPKGWSQILGGLQFSHPFSSTQTKYGFSGNDIQAEGCPTYPTPCNLLTPGEGLENVLSISYFPGTAAGPGFCAYTDPSVYGCGSTAVDYGNFNYQNAPMNFVQIYDADILYASGLAQCSIIDITGRIASPGIPAQPPDITACQVAPSNSSYADVQLTQQELNLASQAIASVAELPAP